MTWLVKRFRRGTFVKDYGPFDDQETADRVARFAIEKHRGSTVVVEPRGGPRAQEDESRYPDVSPVDAHERVLH